MNTTSTTLNDERLPFYINDNLPTANISVKRNRVKHYQNTVYLKNNTSFEIELWNPMNSPVLAKISVNGTLISNAGIIINPGQRHYLERFIDNNYNFIFKTYNAENSKEGLAAIENNGDIYVTFYNEEIFYPKYTFTNNWYVYSDSSTYPNIVNEVSSSNQYNYQTTTNLSEIETGRVTGGENSNQELVNGYGAFSQIPYTTINLKILPASKLPTSINEIRTYCSNCGRRWRSNENFCPICGVPKNS